MGEGKTAGNLLGKKPLQHVVQQNRKCIGNIREGVPRERYDSCAKRAVVCRF